jgi:hypothetical protein
LGTTQYEPPNIAESKPTAVSYPTVEAFTLTPKAGGMTVSDSINDNKSIDSQPPAGSCNSRSDNGSDVGLLSMFLFIAALSSQTFRRKL